MKIFTHILSLAAVSLLAMLLTGCSGAPKIKDRAPGHSEWLTYEDGKCFEEMGDGFEPRECYFTGYLLSYDELDRILQSCISYCD